MKWRDVYVDIKTLSPGGCLHAPVPGLYTCIKSWKKLSKFRLQRDFFETCNKWPKWQDVPVDIKILSPGGYVPVDIKILSPEGYQPLPLGYIHV